MKAIGDPMEISEVLGNKSCFKCNEEVHAGDLIHCANCNSSAHAFCARTPNWCCCNPQRMQEEADEEEDAEAEEEEALSGETDKYTVALSPYGVFQSVRPLGNRVLVKTKSSEDESSGDRLEIGQIVDVGEGRTSCSSFQAGEDIVYYHDAGTRLILNEQEYILLGEDDVLGFFEFEFTETGASRCEDVRYLTPVADRVLIRVVEVEDQMARGLLLTDPSPTMGTVMSVGPDASEIKSPSNVLYCKSAGHEVISHDGRHYTIVRKSDVVALLSFKASSD